MGTCASTHRYPRAPHTSHNQLMMVQVSHFQPLSVFQCTQCLAYHIIGMSVACPIQLQQETTRSLHEKKGGPGLSHQSRLSTQHCAVPPPPLLCEKTTAWETDRVSARSYATCSHFRLGRVRDTILALIDVTTGTTAATAAAAAAAAATTTTTTTTTTTA